MIFFHYLKPGNLPAAAKERDTLSNQREIILQQVLNILLAIYTVGLPLVLLFWPEVIRSGRTSIYLLTYLVLASITVIRNIEYRIRAGMVVVALQGLGTLALIQYGLSGTGTLFLFGAAIISILMFDKRLGRFLAYVSLIVIAVVGFLMVTNRMPLPPVEIMANSGSASQWVVAGMVFAFLTSLILSSIYSVFGGMSTSLQEQKRLTLQLEQEQASLERRVEERSADLVRRISQFEIASEIAREISGATNLERLLTTAVNLIRDRFDFYHVSVFIVDSREEFAELRAATGEAGRTMLERNHRLKIGEVGVVGYVIQRGEARIASDVSSDIVHYNNPLLPRTRSEMALPLKRGSNTIGALDVQSTTEYAFSQEDVRILQIIADQLAIAFEKTLLVEELSRSIEELDSSYRATTLKSWRSHLKNSRQKTAFRYRNSRIENTVVESKQAQEALEKGQPVLKSLQVWDQDRPRTVLAVPIKMRNQVLGVVDIQFESANVSPDLISLIQNTVDRLAVALENARLLEEIQLRAERERLVSEVTSKVRAASDVDTILQIAVQEIGKSLGVSEVMVQLRKDA
jgi:GAF domain-containing protein